MPSSHIQRSVQGKEGSSPSSGSPPTTTTTTSTSSTWQDGRKRMMIGAHRAPGNPAMGSHRSSDQTSNDTHSGNNSDSQYVDLAEAMGQFKPETAPAEPQYIYPSEMMGQLKPETAPAEPQYIYPSEAMRQTNPESSPADTAHSQYVDLSGQLNPETSPVNSSAAPAIASSAPSAKYETKPMMRGMTDFDSTVTNNRIAGAKMPSKTYYANSAAERANFQRKFVDGKLVNGDGTALDTIGSIKPGAVGAKGDRHIFTMDDQGGITSADAIAETTRRGEEAQRTGASYQERFHHSSFQAGKAVAGAGELQVRDGQVEIVSDTSGHYRPGSKQTFQTVKELEDQKAGIEKIGVEFVGKRGGEKALQASALELLGYEGHGEANAEQQMRVEHGKKDAVLSELLQKTQKSPRFDKPSNPGPAVPVDSVDESLFYY